MSAATARADAPLRRLAAYLLVVVTVFALGAGLGAAAGPIDVGGEAPATPSTTVAPGDAHGLGGH